MKLSKETLQGFEDAFQGYPSENPPRSREYCIAYNRTQRAIRELNLSRLLEPICTGA